MAPPPPCPIARHHGLDWLRIAAFALLILFHIGMFFVPGHWIVKTAQPVHWIGYPMLALMPWRLPLLFVVSGYASRALLSRDRDSGAFVAARSRRLLIPLAFGVAVIVPPQTWIRLIEQTGHAQPYLAFWTCDWFRFGTIDGVELPNTEHLWFVVYLWMYSVALAAALAFATPAFRARAQAAFLRLAIGWRLIWVPLGVLGVARMAMLFTVSEAHGLFDDWVGDLVYLPAFLFGFALAGTPALWPVVLRLWRPALGVVLACLALLVGIEHAYADHAPHVPQALRRSAELAMGWCAILLLLGAAHRWLQRDHRWRGTLSEAVFPFYLIHQTIIVVLGWHIRDRALGPAGEFAILLAGTAAGCLAFYAIGRRIGWLRPLIGLAPVRRAAAMRATPLDA